MGMRAELFEALPHMRRVLTRFGPHLRAQRGLLIGAMAALFCEIALRLLEPWPLKFVFDGIFGEGRADAGNGGAIDPGAMILFAALAVVVLTGLRAVAAYAATVGLALAGNRMLTACRGDLFAHLQGLPLAYHAKARTGDLITRLITDVGRLQDVAITAVMPLFAHALTLVGMLIVMFVLDWRLAMIALPVFPVFMLVNTRLTRRIREVARQQRHREGQMASSAAESMGAMKLVQAYGLEELQQQAFRRQNEGTLREGVKGQRLSARLERTVDVLVALATAGVLWWGAWLAIRGDITPGDLIVFLAYLKNAFKPLRDIAKFTARIAKAGASADRILEVLDTPRTIQDRENAIEAPIDVRSLTFDDVSFEYEPGRPALTHVTFEAVPDRVIAIVGPSGAGKSTLANLLLRLYEPTSGSVLMNGLDTRTMALRSLRSRIGVVLQEGVVLGVSVRENIAYGQLGASDEQIERAAQIAGADEFIAQLPAGYDTILGERGQTLSGGQRQRIAIARAALRNAPILVLDEPATGLDRESERAVNDALSRLGRGRITLVITHDLRAASGADEILFLEEGRVVERGTHAQLIQRGGSYASMHRLQSAAHDRGDVDAPALSGG